MICVISLVLASFNTLMKRPQKAPTLPSVTFLFVCATVNSVYLVLMFFLSLKVQLFNYRKEGKTAIHKSRSSPAFIMSVVLN